MISLMKYSMLPIGRNSVKMQLIFSLLLEILKKYSQYLNVFDFTRNIIINIARVKKEKKAVNCPQNSLFPKKIP